MLADLIDGVRILLLLVISLAILLALVSLISIDGRERMRLFYERLLQHLSRAIRLSRAESNPVLSPREGSFWESLAAFNPAAVLIDGRVHLLYRAIGSDGISRWGYASSADGVHFDRRLPFPVFALMHPRERPGLTRRFDPILYPSGGSWGGAEDPRAVVLDGRVYVTFNAFDGWDCIRVAATSTLLASFVHQHFRWADPILLSPSGTINKNWVLFPERINGKIAILHSITPDVQIEYVDRLEDIGAGAQPIQSRHNQKDSRDGWEKTLRSAGPPPIATPHGWLVLYHAHCADEPHRYKLGAMLLDKNNPTLVLHRAYMPLLTPDAWYENNWKPGVVYACGAVVKDGDLMVYYGGGDRTVNLARTRFEPFLAALLHDKAASLGTVSIDVADEPQQ